MHPIQNFIRDPEGLRRIAGGTIALFSGSFNPPHNGHRMLAELALYYGIEAVIFCPHSLNASKREMLAPVEDRLVMLSLLLGESPHAAKFYVIDPAFVESFREPATFGVIREHLPVETSVSILVGSDSIREDYPQFLRSFDHLVVERSAADKGYTKILRQRFVALPELNATSSTHIRQLYRAKAGKHHNERVHAYISDRGLFV